ncbi:MAG: MotA/TolQ/ExbB proton channel family protein [Candidatus Zixiibacteriota bacterium]|nr:MAG: MotA/TolQ/ExbB proton channel family protein [candidate division Zixibacteria bacterium]
MQAMFILPLGFFSGGIWQIIGQSSLFGALILTILVCFSLISWGIMFNKWRAYARVERESLAFLNIFRKSSKLSAVVSQAKALRMTPFSGIFIRGYDEINEILSSKKTPGNPAGNNRPLTKSDIEIIAMTLERATAEEIGILERRVVFLATTANTAPFLGLLGTVVGVMDAFWSIGERGSASLAVVAPGIAEALLATIVGLGAAIPAVIGFNWASNKLKYFYDKASNFALEFEARITKDLVG